MTLKVLQKPTILGEMEIQSAAFQSIFKDTVTSLSPVVPVSITYHPIHSNLIIQDNGAMEKTTAIQHITFLKRTVDYRGLLFWASGGVGVP